MKYLVVILSLFLVACGEAATEATPQIRIVGEISTPTSAVTPTLTPSPTPLASLTPLPTPQQVTVSRVHPDLDPAQVTPLAPGARLPDLEVTDIDGQVWRLREIDQPLVLNFWSVGCGSCFYEFPLLQDAVDYYGDELVVLSINIADFPDATRVIAQQLGISFPMVVDENAEFFTTYFNGVVVPTTIFVNAEGAVTRMVIGTYDAYNLDLYLQSIGLASRG